MNKFIVLGVLFNSLLINAAVPKSNKTTRTLTEKQDKTKNSKSSDVDAKQNSKNKGLRALSAEEKKQIKAFVELKLKNSKELASKELQALLQYIDAPLKGELNSLMTNKLLNPEQKAGRIVNMKEYKALID